jgi:hypothetical protein
MVQHSTRLLGLQDKINDKEIVRNADLIVIKTQPDQMNNTVLYYCTLFSYILGKKGWVKINPLISLT